MTTIARRSRLHDMTLTLRHGVGSFWASPRTRAIAKAAAGLAILLALIAEAGAEPFLRGLAAVSPATILAALALTAVGAAAASWRWRLIARRLGLELGWPAAFGAYYRSLFLNSVLPGGVIGDVHRAVAHGRSVDRIGQASRAVAAERGLGQAVQLVLVIVVLATLGLSAYAPVAGAVVLALLLLCAALVVAAAVSTRVRAVLGREWRMLRPALTSPATVVGVIAASLVVVGTTVATFFVAALAVGVDAPAPRIAAAALVAVLASSIPLNIGGWGPREAAAAWAFAALGLGAAAGLAASTAFGVLALISVLPGVLVIAASVVSSRLHRLSAVAGKEPSS